MVEKYIIYYFFTFSHLLSTYIINKKILILKKLVLGTGNGGWPLETEDVSGVVMVGWQIVGVGVEVWLISFGRWRKRFTKNESVNQIPYKYLYFTVNSKIISSWSTFSVLPKLKIIFSRATFSVLPNTRRRGKYIPKINFCHT